VGVFLCDRFFSPEMLVGYRFEWVLMFREVSEMAEVSILNGFEDVFENDLLTSRWLKSYFYFGWRDRTLKTKYSKPSTVSDCN
jgi:hypothetical protein